MKKLLSLVLALCALLAMSTTAGAAQTLALNHVGATDHPYQAGAEKFAELVNQYTNGEIKVDVFPASQIASGAKSIEMVQTYTLDIAVESTMALSNFVPEFGVLDMPFIFSSKQQAFAVLDGKVGAKLNEYAEKQGLKILGYWDNGFRSITSTKGIVDEPSDLQELKIRTPESTVFLKTFETLGAVPTAMAVSEVFSAMQLGTVDASENSDSNNVKNKYIEICPYYSATRHIYTAEPVVMNLTTFESFTPEQQEAITKAAREATDYQREQSLALDEKLMQQVKDAGCELFVLEDNSAFKATCEPVYEFFRPQFGELIDMINAETSGM